MADLIPESWIKLQEKRYAFEVGNFFHLKKFNEVVPFTWDDAKFIRNDLLSESDWVTLPDANPSNKQAWLDYRQALRDIPQNFSNPEDIIWPPKP